MHTAAAPKEKTDLQFVRRHFRRNALITPAFSLCLFGSVALTVPELRQDLALFLSPSVATPEQVEVMQHLLSVSGLLLLLVSALGTLSSSVLLTHLGLRRLLHHREGGLIRATCALTAALGLCLTVFSLLALWRALELGQRVLTRLLAA